MGDGEGREALHTCGWKDVIPLSISDLLSVTACTHDRYYGGGIPSVYIYYIPGWP